MVLMEYEKQCNKKGNKVVLYGIIPEEELNTCM